MQHKKSTSVLICLTLFLILSILIIPISTAQTNGEEDKLYVTVIEQVGDAAKILDIARVDLEFGSISGERSTIGTDYTMSGHAVFSNLTPGIYTLTASASAHGYKTAQKEFTKKTGETGYLTIALEKVSANATGSARIALLEKYSPQTKLYLRNGKIEILEGIEVIRSSGTESGEVVFSELPVGFYMVHASAPSHIVEYADLQIKSDSETWLPIGLEIAECKELIEGHNGDIDKRINIILFGGKYKDIETFKQRMIEIINIDGYNESGLLSDMPLADYKNSFNIFYLNNLMDSYQNRYIEPDMFCPEINKNREYITFINQTRAFGNAGICSSSASVRDDGTSVVKEIASHEFGHSFGCLRDEYSYDYATCEESCIEPSAPNCDIATTKVGCPKWCHGKPRSVDELAAEDCSLYTESECYQQVLCEWLKTDNTCVNMVDYCISFSNENDCKQNVLGCIWITLSDPYFQSNCIPMRLDGLNIGNDCEFDTGCYKVCEAYNWYSSYVATKMKYLGLPFGAVNSRAFIERIQSILQPPTAPESAEKPEYISYDNFEPNGSISGGIISLDDIVSNPELMNVVKESDYYGESVKKEDIDLRKVNIDRIVRAYLGEPLEPIGPVGSCPQDCVCDENNVVVACMGAGGGGEVAVVSTETVTQMVVSEQNVVDSVGDIELQLSESREPVYQVNGKKKANVLFIFPVEMEIQIIVDAETGNVEEVKKPWWSFLAW